MPGLSLVRQVLGWLVVAMLSVPAALWAQAVGTSLASSAAPADLRCAAPSQQRSTARRVTPATTTVTSGSMHLTVACVEESEASRAAAPSPSTPPLVPSVSTTSAPSASPASAGATQTSTRADADAITRLAVLFPQAVLLLLAIAAIMLAYAALVVLRGAFAPARSTGNADSFLFQRHWGGFGGGSTGWVISERLVRVIVGLVLGSFAAALAMQLVPGEGELAARVVGRHPDAAAASASTAKE